jgi:hypothetical protein
MSVEDARQLTSDGSNQYYDYLRGRVMKVDLSKDQLKTGLYDRDNGEGAAERALAPLLKAASEATKITQQTTDEQFKRLLLAANVLLDNHMDLGDCYVHNDNDDDDYPEDGDGDRWYQDWWELREAIRGCEQTDPETAEKWFDMIGDTTITREALDSGKIVHTGWKLNGQDTTRMDPRPEHQCDVQPGMYFDASGKFLGPDENGLVPTFELMPHNIEKVAFEGPETPDRGYTMRVSYLKPPASADALVEVMKDKVVVRMFLFPAYKIYNLQAHFGEIVDSEIEKNDNGYRQAAWCGIGPV